MHDVDLPQFLHLREAQGQRIDGGGELSIAPRRDLRRRLLAAHMQVARVEPLRAPAVDFDLDAPGKLAAQVLHMHARAAIHLGRILPCHQANPHRTLHP